MTQKRLMKGIRIAKAIKNPAEQYRALKKAGFTGFESDYLNFTTAFNIKHSKYFS
jgi:hypothetical protein